MSVLIGIELPAPISDPSPDPTYRNIVEWERVARDILALQAGLIVSPPAIPADDLPNAAEEVEPDTSSPAEESPRTDPGSTAAAEVVTEAEPAKTRGKKK
jgi:hypothetical protein